VQKMFFTQKSKKELEILIDNINSESGVYRRSNGKIYVSCGRAGAYYNIDIDTPGQIRIKRCISYCDWFLIITFSIMFAVVAGILALTGDILGTIVGMMIICGSAISILYPIYVLLPHWRLKRILNKW